MSRFLLGIIITISIATNYCDSARILAVFPAPAFSHQAVFRKVTVELWKRGHELVIFTPNPINDPKMENFTEINTSDGYGAVPDFFNTPTNRWLMADMFSVFSEEILNKIFSNPEMKGIISPNSKEHFDLIIVECLIFDAVYALMARFNAPIVGMSSLQLQPTPHYDIGNPAALAYSPGVYDAATDNMDFWERLNVAYRNTQTLLYDYYVHTPRHDALVAKHFGSGYPSVRDLAKNFSLMLVTNHVALSYPKPNLPNVIEIGGIAFDGGLKGIEPELKAFLDGAVNGFVYFSLGSSAKGVHLPSDKLNVIKAAIAELPYRVLWKWENETLVGKPANAYVSKWIPQNDVLAHPNIKVFVYQGGLQSTDEAINFGVPLVGIPIFADQEFNIRKLESIGVCKRLSLATVTKDDFVHAVTEVITDNGYNRRILQLRDLYNDQPSKPVERAVWWIEYVIRHKGANHLRTRVRFMPWYQRELLDVIGFVIVTLLFGCYVVYKTAVPCLNLITNHLGNSKSSKNKIA